MVLCGKSLRTREKACTCECVCALENFCAHKGSGNAEPLPSAQLLARIWSLIMNVFDRSCDLMWKIRFNVPYFYLSEVIFIFPVKLGNVKSTN